MKIINNLLVFPSLKKAISNLDKASKMISEREHKRYIIRNPTCPFCGTEDSLVTNSYRRSSGKRESYIYCNDCGEEFI